MSNRFRRNGKLSSCEPCRISKLRCDHAQPQCGRCVRRKLAPQQCYYHPAPMAQTKAPDVTTTAVGYGLDPAHQMRAVAGSSDLPSEALADEAERATGLIGMSEYSDPTLTADDRRPPPERFYASLDHQGVVAPSMRAGPDEDIIVKGAKLLETLLSLTSNLDATFTQWSTKWDEQSVLGPIERAAWQATHEALLPLRESRSHGAIRHLSRTIAERSCQKVQFPQAAEHSALYRTFSGEALRWELVGMYCSRLGIYFGCGHEAKPAEALHREAVSKDKKAMLCKAFFACSDCASLCASLGQVNDLTLFLLSTQIGLATWCFGDDSYHVWRLGGDISSVLYALKFHKMRAVHEGAPLYLVELRKRVIGLAHQHDKLAAAFVGRPPRLNRQYCDVVLPLDLSNEALEGSHESLEMAIAMLDSDGWDRSRTLRPVSQQRVQMILSPFREEVLELSLGSSVLDWTQRARSILERLMLTWQSLPHVTDQMPDWENLSWFTSVQRLFTRLEYLYTKFLLHKLLVGQEREQRADLLRVAHEILTLVLSTFKQRFMIVTYRLDMEWTMIFYAMPCASVLLWEFLEWTPPSHTGVQVPSRATLLQDISTLVICCDWLAESGESNYAICKQAQTIFSKGLDIALNNNTRTHRVADRAPTAQTAQADGAQLPAAHVEEFGSLAHDPEWAAWLETVGLQSDSWLNMDPTLPSVH